MLLNNIRNGVFLLWPLITLWMVKTSRCAKILGLFPHASESHFMVMRTFVMELARREHSIHLLSSHRLDETNANIKEFTIEPEFQFWQEVQTQAGVKKDLQALSELNEVSLEKALSKAGYQLGLHYFSNPHVQELLKLPPEQFDYDLIIVDLFYTEALLAFGYYFRTPTIAVMSTDFANYMDQVQDNIVPAPCLPFEWDKIDLNLNYLERLSNLRRCLGRRKRFHTDNYAKQEKLIQQFFVSHTSNNLMTPTIMQLQNQLSLLLINNYMPLTAARPLLPNMLIVGGLQVRGARELPWNIKRFLDEARNGAIYMNLGDHNLCSTISQQKLDVLLHIFSAIQKHVIWTCHDVNTLEGLPKNVMIQHMVAQTDILAHPHVKLFITNGDLLSVQEGIMRMVPLLGLPLFINEHQNLQLIEKLQIGLRLDYTNLTEPSLKWALNTLIGNEFHILNIRDVSRMFRDRPLSGLSNAMFWLDYILKYGSTSLHTPAVGIPLHQLHLFDLIPYYVFLALILTSILVVISYLIIMAWNRQKKQKIITKLN